MERPSTEPLAVWGEAVPEIDHEVARLQPELAAQQIGVPIHLPDRLADISQMNRGGILEAASAAAQAGRGIVKTSPRAA